MATKRDLLEANAFRRGRLVVAFLSGATDGGEADRLRSGRVLVGGLLLALLVIAAAVIGSLVPRG